MCKNVGLKPEGMRLLGKIRRRYEDEIEREDMDWIHVAQDRDQ